MAKYVNNSFNPILRYYMNRRNLTVVDISKLLNRSREYTYTYLTNPTTMTINQIMTLAGYFGIDSVRLYYLIVTNQQQLTKEGEATLQDLINRNKESI